MNITNLKTLLKTLIINKVPVTPMLWGPHGVGKSSVVKQIGAELGYRVLILTLSQKEAVDVSGVLYTHYDEALKMSVTSSHPPDWFADACVNGKLILFLDEFNMARREVLNASFQLVLDRSLNNKMVADTVFIICAGNPEDDRYDVTPLSESLRDRLMHIQVTSDAPSWLQWAEAPGSPIDPQVISFIKSVPSALRYEDERDAKFPVEIRHSERSWERVSIIKALPLSTAIKLECFRGIVGPDWSVTFMQTIGSDAPLTGQEIVEGTVATVARFDRWIDPDSLRIDLLSASLSNLINACKADPTYLKHSGVVFRFLLGLPADLFSLGVSGLNSVTGWSTLILKNEKLKKKIEEIKAVGKSAA